MSDYVGPSIDPTNPRATLQATSELMRNRDLPSAERLLGWALDFNPKHSGLLRGMSELRWEEGKVEESLDWVEQALAADRGDAENYSYIGLLRMRQGRYAEAAEHVGRSVEMKPDNPHYLRRLADIMAHLGRGEDAVALAERVVLVRPKDAQSYHLLTSLYLRYGHLEGAETTLLTAIREASDRAAALRRMAEFCLARGEVDSARNWAEQAHEAAPDDPANYDLEASVALINGDLAAAENALRAATTLSKANGHHKRRLSNVLKRRGDREGALSWAKRAIADHPQDLAGHNHLADLYLSQGQQDDAYAVLEAAVAQTTKPSDASAIMRRLSSLERQKGKAETAWSWAERAVSFNPFDAENHAHLVWFYLQGGELASAHTAAQRAQELAPGNSSHSRRISDIAWRQGEVEAAFEWAARAVDIHPTDAQNYAHQGILFMRQGQNGAAELPLSRAVELAPMDAGLLTRLSDIKMRLGKQEEAFALAERAINASPRELIGLNHLASLHLRLGALNDAYAVLGRAVEIEPAYVPLLRRLADVAQRRGDQEAAFSWLRQALDADPRDPHTYNQLATVELTRGDQEAAEAVLTRATEVAGTNPAFHRRLSDILNRRGDKQGAIYWAEQIASDFPTDPAGPLQLGALHLAAGQLDEAEAAFLRASELATTPAQALGPLHRLSDVAARRNDVRGALSWSTKGTEAAPREAGAYNHLAALHLAYGDLASAQRVGEKALEVAPTDVGALRRLSEIVLRQGRTEEALTLARQAVTANPEDPHSYNYEASVLLAAGDLAGAQISVEKALKYAPAEITFLRRAEYLRALTGSS
jgi:cellulose synthase operon protein C